MVVNTYSITWTIDLDVLNTFDKIEHTAGLLLKVKFYCVYVRTLFLIESFVTSRKL